MDTFYEQIVNVKKSTASVLLILLIWAVAFVGCVAMILTWILGSFSILVMAGLIFGAYKLSSRFNTEYEYIITNGTMDIDKIVNKSSRKRILSFELSSVSEIKKFTPDCLYNANKSNLTFACSKDEPGAYMMVSEKEGSGAGYVVFAPNDRTKDAIVKFVPKFVANSAFK